MIELIRKYLQPPENFIFGFAELHGLTRYKNFNFGISIGKKLDDSIVDRLEYGPTIEYYKHYRDTNRELAEIAGKIQSDLAGNGIESIVIKPTISPGDQGYDDYMETLTYDVSHKMVATRAGLGWIGRTDLLITKKFGPRLRLVSILLKQDPGIRSKPVNKSRCGKCMICVDKCPGKTANGRLWDTAVTRESFFDAFKCRETCGRVALEKLGVNERICGLCVCVCPLGQP